MRDVLHFHNYDYIPTEQGMKLQLASMFSASLEIVQNMLGQHKDKNQALQEFNASLAMRLKPEYPESKSHGDM